MRVSIFVQFLSRLDPSGYASVVDMETNDTKVMQFNAVLKPVFDEHYPHESYVGKMFNIIGVTNNDGSSMYYDVREIRLVSRTLSKFTDGAGNGKKGEK